MNKETVECPRCYGHGWIHVYSLLAENPCPLCNKKGKVTVKQYNEFIDPCSVCLWPDCSECDKLVKANSCFKI
jgi:DnaJ-class molecular chaperone